MGIAAAICAPIFVFFLPILWLLTHLIPGWFGRDEIWALQGPCLFLLPLSFWMWWLAIRHIWREL